MFTGAGVMALVQGHVVPVWGQGAVDAAAAAEDLEMHQLDITAAFLNGELDPEDDVYVEQPQGYQEGGGGEACHLRKALYGLRQAPRSWNKRLRAELLGMGFTESQADPSLFISQHPDGSRAYVLVYVDDNHAGGRAQPGCCQQHQGQEHVSLCSARPG
jgi:hypothetical protein